MNLLHHSTNRRDAMLQTMFKNAPIGMLILNRQGVVMGGNPKALSLLGYSNKELVGKHLKDLIPNQFQYSTCREGYLNDPSVRQMIGEKEILAIGKEGKKIPVLIELSDATTPGDDIGIAFICLAAGGKKMLKKNIENE